MAKLSDDDLDFLWTHLGELARAAHASDDLHIQRIVSRLVSESDDPGAMSDACYDAVARLTGYRRPTRSMASTARDAPDTASVDVGDTVIALAPLEWAGKEGLVVFIDLRSERFPIGVEFRLHNRVAVWTFAADQLQRHAD
jgi:hypothetical protein